MMQQAFDFGGTWTPPVYVVGASHRERWDAVKTANPWLLPMFIGMARDCVDRGYQAVGVKHLVEVFRWQRAGKVVGDTYRFNNSWTAHLARDLIEACPKLDDYIQTRTAA